MINDTVLKRDMIRKISEVQFAFFECALYLDTHPDDKNALEKYEMFRKNLTELTAEYEQNFGPLTLTGDFGNDGFDWTNSPWPWEREAN